MIYDKYHLTARDCIFLLGEFVLTACLISFLFYDSVIAFLFALLLFPIFIGREKKKKIDRQIETLDSEFLIALQALSTALAAGFSSENSFLEAQLQMERIYGSDALITKELEYINKQIQNKVGIEEALQDFAVRSGSEEIEDFAIVFAIARSSGNDYTKVIASCIELMETANNTKEEQKVLIRGKQLEMKIMSFIPLGIIGYMRMSYSGFIDVLYHNAVGVMIMTACLLVYAASIYLAERMCRLKV